MNGKKLGREIKEGRARGQVKEQHINAYDLKGKGEKAEKK